MEEIYNNLKKAFPEAILWISKDDYILTFSECAIDTSAITESILTENINGLALTGFQNKYKEKYLKKMLKQKRKVILMIT